MTARELVPAGVISDVAHSVFTGADDPREPVHAALFGLGAS